jgi:hypothetical protein
MGRRFRRGLRKIAMKFVTIIDLLVMNVGKIEVMVMRFGWEVGGVCCEGKLEFRAIFQFPKST